MSGVMLKREDQSMCWMVVWGEAALLGRYIAASTFTVTPEHVGCLRIEATVRGPDRTGCVMEGGLLDEAYTVENVVLLSDGDRATRAVTIRIARPVPDGSTRLAQQGAAGADSLDH